METIAGRLEPRLSGYADVNGLHLYYELSGEGSPLVLLHGGMLTIGLGFGTLIPGLAGTHQGRLRPDPAVRGAAGGAGLCPVRAGAS
jgi:hypothetical protein